MPSNNSSGIVHYLAGKFPGRIGWLFSPGGFKEPRPWLPYAIDNGKFSSWEKKRAWNEREFFDLLDRCWISACKPEWIAVPDEVGNRDETLRLWDKYVEKIRRYKRPLAFVVQDGMTTRDVPKEAEVIFVGGSYEWKWRNVALFCAAFPRVHVGRVNWISKLEFCEQAGAESCDGTGWFRGDQVQTRQLIDFVSGERRETTMALL